MAEETTVEGESNETPAAEIPGATQAAAARATAAATATAAAVKDAFGSLSKAVATALADREHAVTVRVNREVLSHLDILVEAEITKTRSDSAAYMINEGIKANKELFDRIDAIAKQTAALRSQVREALEQPAEAEE